MNAVYGLINLLPKNFEPCFAPRLNKLFRFLRENQGLSSKEVAKQYLASEERLKYSNVLKNELKRALTRYLIANPSWTNNANKLLYEDCYRDFATYKILLLSNERVAAIEIAKRLIKNVQRIENYNLLHTIANDLLLHYSSINTLTHQQKEFRTLAIQALENVKVEARVRQFHSKVIAICNTRESFTVKNKQLFKEAVEHCRPLLKDGRNQINRFIYVMIVCQHMAECNYLKMIFYCDQALSSFPKKHPNIRSLSFIFLFHKVFALIPLRRFEEARDIARQLHQMMPTGNFNWHLALIRRILIYLYMEEYQEAYHLFKAHQKHKSTDKVIVEYWNIIHGYIYFLIQVNLITPYKKERFLLGKFVNEMSLFTRDKAGHNINILIIQILVQMQRGQYNRIIDRMDSLREYIRVYTRGVTAKRVRIFIQMILKMESARFHRTGTELKTHKMLQKLNKIPLIMGQNLAVEIIPFPVLWNEMLRIIEGKFRERGAIPRSQK